MGAQRLYVCDSVVVATGHPVATQEVGPLEHVKQRAAQRADVVVGALRRLQLRPQRVQQRVKLAAVVAGHVVQLATVRGGSHL